MENTKLVGSSFFLGLILGMFFMGILETCIPTIGFHDAKISKENCEKHLPRDQICVPNYVPGSKP